jgi:hypothetical protein
LLCQEEVEEEDGAGGISLWDGGGGAGQDYGPWGDAESKAFYEELPGLLRTTTCDLSVAYTTERNDGLYNIVWKLIDSE